MCQLLIIVFVQWTGKLEANMQNSLLLTGIYGGIALCRIMYGVNFATRIPNLARGNDDFAIPSIRAINQAARKRTKKQDGYDL